MKVGNVKVFFRYAEDQSQIKAVAINCDTKEEITSREVKLRHGDKPDKILGRKYAFKKLMDHARNNDIFPGKVVEAFWKQFGSTCKQPKQRLAY